MKIKKRLSAKGFLSRSTPYEHPKTDDPRRKPLGLLSNKNANQTVCKGKKSKTSLRFGSRRSSNQEFTKGEALEIKKKADRGLKIFPETPMRDSSQFRSSAVRSSSTQTKEFPAAFPSLDQLPDLKQNEQKKKTEKMQEEEQQQREQQKELQETQEEEEQEEIIQEFSFSGRKVLMGYDVTAAVTIRDGDLDLCITCPSPVMDICCPCEPYVIHETHSCKSRVVAGKTLRKRQRQSSNGPCLCTGSVTLCNLQQPGNAVAAALKTSKLTLQKITFTGPSLTPTPAQSSERSLDTALFSHPGMRMTVHVTALSFVKLQLELQHQASAVKKRLVRPTKAAPRSELKAGEQPKVKISTAPPAPTLKQRGADMEEDEPICKRKQTRTHEEKLALEDLSTCFSPEAAPAGVSNGHSGSALLVPAQESGDADEKARYRMFGLLCTVGVSMCANFLLQ